MPIIHCSIYCYHLVSARDAVIIGQVRSSHFLYHVPPISITV